MFLSLVATMGGADVLSADVSSELSTPPMEQSGACDISGWDAVVDAVVCAGENIWYLTTLIGLKVGNKYVKYLLIVPFTVVISYIIVSVLRGGS